MRHQIFLASYSKDAEWLIYCLSSIRKFAIGFEPTVVCVSQADYAEFSELCPRFLPDVQVKVKDGDGFMRAQIGMMEADLFCPDADVIYLVGSDCVFMEYVCPLNYGPTGKPAVLMNSYAKLSEHGHDRLSSFADRALCWRRGVERVLGFEPDFEYMRRLPSVFPAAIFAPMRLHVARLHDMEFGAYIIEGNKARRDTSEANILGTYAHRFMPETCDFVNCDNVQWEDACPVGYPSPLIQFWSHGGLDKKMGAPETGNFTLPDGSHTHGRTPREVLESLGL